jgi:hypothetical protein
MLIIYCPEQVWPGSLVRGSVILAQFYATNDDFTKTGGTNVGKVEEGNAFSAG